MTTVKFINSELGEFTGLIIHGEPWFLAGQVCRVLGIKNSRDAVNEIGKKLKTAGAKDVGITDTLIQTSGGKQKATIINEQIFYELVFNSRKQKAVLFRAWVTGEVLPTLRKTGTYRMQGKLIRKVETNAIKLLVEQATEQGSKNGGRYYLIITKLVNKLLDIEAGQRDNLPPEKLRLLSITEEAIAHIIEQEVKAKSHYKDIYKKIQAKATELVGALV